MWPGRPLISQLPQPSATHALSTHSPSTGSQNAPMWARPLCLATKRPSPISAGTSNSSCFRLLSRAGDLTSHLGPTIPSPISVMRVDGIPSFPTDYVTSLYSCRTIFLTFFSSHACLPSAFTWLQYPQPLWGHPLSDPTTSLDSHHLLPLVASQISPIPGYPVSTLPDPVNPQVWDISTLVIAHHHQSVLVPPKDTSSFPFKTPAPHF